MKVWVEIEPGSAVPLCPKCSMGLMYGIIPDADCIACDQEFLTEVNRRIAKKSVKKYKFEV